MDKAYQELVNKGLKALREGDTLGAMVFLQNAARVDPSPTVLSALAYCLARECRDFRQAFKMCQTALMKEPGNPEHYYLLGRIHLLARHKRQAILTFRKGLKHKRYQPIIDELHRLGLRKPPVFNTLAREHFLNRSVGKFLSILGKR